MGVTVGEVTAVLKAQDEMSAVFDRAGEASQKMGAKIEESGHHVQSFADQFEHLAVRIAERIAIYETFREAINFAEEAVASASRLEELGRATGIATDELQRMNYAAAEFGVDAEMMARAVEMFSAKLAGGDKNATTAVASLGLSVNDLLALGPEEAFLRFTEAVSTLEDPMTKNAVLTEAFGGRLAKLLASMGDIRKLMADTPPISIVDEHDIETAHKFDVALEHLGTMAKAFVPGMLTIAGEMLGLSAKEDVAAESAERFKKIHEEISLALGEQVAPAIGKVITNAEVMQNRIEHLRTDAMTPLSADTQRLILELHGLGDSAADLAKAFRIPESAVSHFLETQKELEAEGKKFRAAMAEWDAASVNLKVTYDSLDGTLKDNIETMLKAGLSHQVIKDALGAEEIQIKSVDSALKDMAAAQKLAAKAAEENAKLVAEYYDLVAQHSGVARDKEIADIHKWADDLTATRHRVGTDNAAFYNDLAAISKEKMGAVGVNFAELDTMSREHFQNIADSATATYEAALMGVRHLSQEGMEELHQKMLQARKDLVDWKDVADASMDAVTKKAKAAADAMGGMSPPNSRTYDLSTEEGMTEFKKANPAATVNAPVEYFKTHSMADAVRAGLINLYAGYTSGSAMPSFAGGGSGDFGSGTLAMLHGKETITTEGKSGGITNIFHVNGTAISVANQIADVLMRQAKQGRQFGAA